MNIFMQLNTHMCVCLVLIPLQYPADLAVLRRETWKKLAKKVPSITGLYIDWTVERERAWSFHTTIMYLTLLHLLCNTHHQTPRSAIFLLLQGIIRKHVQNWPFLHFCTFNNAAESRDRTAIAMMLNLSSSTIAVIVQPWWTSAPSCRSRNQSSSGNTLNHWACPLKSS